MSSYEPGVCNIGTRQRRRRLLLGVLSLVAAAGVTAWLVATDGPTQYLGVTFLLATLGFVGVLQHVLAFCIGYAAVARYDLTGAGGEAGAVTDADRRRQDQLRALEITVYAVGLGLATTLFVYVLFISPLSP